MKLEDLIVLLPCNSLEDLSLDRSAEVAEQLLSAWSALYHPVLIAAAEGTPNWSRASAPPVETANRLVVIPPFCASEVPLEWRQKAASSWAFIVDDFRDRPSLLEAIFDRLGISAAAVDPELAADFLALGTCHLQVELLTRQLRYMSNLDEMALQREAAAAAQAALAGEQEQARQRLQAAFDLLTEAREYFYPVETYLLDLTLVAPTTLGASLAREVSRGEKVNLLVSGRDVEQMAAREPSTLAAVRQGVETGDVGLIGGEYEEHELPLMPAEAILAEFRRGLACFRQHLGHVPRIFGRRRFGLSPALPQILRKLGYSGALHMSLDEGKFPRGNQSKVRWEGTGGTIIDSMARVPHDAATVQTFLRLSEKLGDVLDLDHAATVVFAHWPSRASSWYDDLRRVSRYAPVLGKFASVTSYFRDTEFVGKTTAHKADQYRSPYLRQAVANSEADPISRWVRYHRRQAAAEIARGLSVMESLVGGGQPVPMAAAPDDGAMAAETQDAAKRIAARLAGTPGAGAPGILVLNPATFARRLPVDTSALPQAPPAEGPVVFATSTREGSECLVEVPAMGFVVVAGSAPADKHGDARRRWAPFLRRSKPRAEKPLVDGNSLRNEFFEVKIDPISGAIQSIRDYGLRENRLGQQIAFRFGKSTAADESGAADGEYSIMAADRLTTVSDGPARAEVRVLGRLMSRAGEQLARYVETVALRRGSRVVEVKIELDIDRLPEGDPWQSYYAVRSAWSDETSDLYRGLTSATIATEANQLESPYFVDIRSGKTATTILTGGLPYHRRIGLRMLDTLLVVPGESDRSFRLGIGIDLGYPWPAALDLLSPEAFCVPMAKAAAAQGWLMHVDCRNVLTTRWEAIGSQEAASATIVGVRGRLMETEGRKTVAHCRSFRTLASARKVDFDGQLLEELKIEDDRIEVPLAGHEWAEIEARFS